nr:hypothetical protein BaRGS_029292 [Batillaria attramentaria]
MDMCAEEKSTIPYHTLSEALLVSMELIVCAVHPPPIRFRDHEHDDHDDRQTVDWNNPVDPADVKGQYVLQAMWMSAITLLTVGYGDVTPYSTCGRLTAVVVGMLGVLITALLVAVMAQKLEQSRAEKYLHTFFSRMRMNRLYKNAAAHVIKSILMLWRLKHLPDGDRKYRKRLLCYGKLMQAVRAMRRWKVSKMQVGESAIGVIEVNAAVSDVHRLTEIITDQQSHLVERSDEMEDRLWTIENKLDHVAKTIARGNQNVHSAPAAQPSGVRIPSPFTLTSSISALSMESKSQGRSGFDVLDELSSAADMETTTAERLAEEYNYDIDDVKNKVKRLDLISREQILDTKRNKKLKKVVLVKKVDKKFLLGESEDFRLKYSFHEGKAVREYFGIGYSGYRATSSVEKADTLDLLLLEAVPQNDTRYKRVLEAIELDFRILRELVKLYAAYYLSKRR